MCVIYDFVCVCIKIDVQDCMLIMYDPHGCFSMAEKVSLIHAFKSGTH